jgi:DNA-directed RNA polymerase subunit RPC12/RpoP
MFIRRRRDGTWPKRGAVCRKCQLESGARRRARAVPGAANPFPALTIEARPRCPACHRFLFVPRPPEPRRLAAHGGPRRKGERAPLVAGSEPATCRVSVHLTATDRDLAVKKAEALGYVGLGPLMRDLLRWTLEEPAASP